MRTMTALTLFSCMVFWGCSATNNVELRNIEEPEKPLQQEEEVPQDTSNNITMPREEIAQDQQDKVEECIVFDDFTETQDYKWGIVNDGVMGGRSQGQVRIQDNALIFSGNIVTRGGGFSSLRGLLDSGVLSDYNSVKLRAKSDGREYRITFRDNQRGNISHRFIIPFQSPGEFEEVIISFTDLEPAYFGRSIQANPFDKESAREIGVILSDGVDGEFELVIDEVSFCR